MRLEVLALLCLTTWVGQALASEATTPYREPNPRMGAFKQPVLWERDKIRIEAPAGYPVCSLVERYSSWLMFFIPIDPATRCEQFPLNADWDRSPDFVVIDPYYDAPLNTPGLEEYIYKYQSFFCAGRPRTKDSPPSEVATVRAPAGNRVLGLETVTCTRTDEMNDRYSKAYVAYKPDPVNLDGRGYTVGAYVHIKNKEAADRLLEQVVNLLKPLE